MDDGDDPPTYELREDPPSPERFVELRDAAGMSTRTIEAAREGVPNSYYVVTAVAFDEVDGGDTDGTVVGIGRVVGDGGTVFQLTDIVVHPDHQGQGLGSQLMDALMDYIEEHAPETAYVNLMADIDGFYERWGFEETRPVSKGMFLPE